MLQKNHITPEALWKAVLGLFELSEPMFRSFGKDVHLEQTSNNGYHVICPNDFTRINIDKKYKDQIASVLGNTLKRDIDVKVILQEQNKETAPMLPAENGQTDYGTLPLFDKKAQEKVEDTLKDRQRGAGLLPKFTFESFIAGRNNNLAYAIAAAVAERPGEQYNPVFMYSGVGLGKTHLIQAIGNRIIQTKPRMRVIYTTGEQFTNELIENLQSGKRGKYAAADFRKKFRKADVLLIDDVQFIIGREATQEEFFHTFNALYMAQKQIVITSDRPPREFNKLEDRITSRFASGIIADIQPPDLEMRTAILRNLRDKTRDNMPNSAIDCVAEHVATNVRELEGAYNQVLANINAQGLDFTQENILQALGNSIKEKRRSPVNMNQILRSVCTYYSVKTVDIKGKRRSKNIVLPRQVAMYLIKDITDTPFMTIGEFLGGRDHTTIMHGVDKIGEALTKTGKIRQDVVNIKQILAQV
jgi:chromosomal replication initiator protein